MPHPKTLAALLCLACAASAAEPPPASPPGPIVTQVMRQNLPVTQHVHAYPAHMTLISITDEKGRITYCNKDFTIVSGYSKQDLLGQPHNILRHPDMPEEAFRDFWDTVQAGRLWSGPVKNRRKNGDTYWVNANATCIRENGKIIGYLSVRTHLPDEVIVAAEALFATMRQEAANGKLKHRLQGGQIHRSGLLPRLRRALHLTPQRKAVLLHIKSSDQKRFVAVQLSTKKG